MKFKEVAEKAAREAGKIIRKNFKKNIKIEKKKDSTLASKVDRKAENKIREIINSEFPDHSLLGEEFGEEDKGSAYKWIIDPLDGTTNFLIQNPFFNTSIALAKNKEVILGVVYDPLHEEFFHAEKGKGAFLNREKINVSVTDKVEDSIITYCHGKTNQSKREVVPIYREMKLGAVDMRQIGAGALELCFVASGRVEAFIDNGVYPWDEAAGSLIVKEAGGKVTDFSGEEWNPEKKTVMASNGKIHQEVLKKIREVR